MEIRQKIWQAETLPSPGPRPSRGGGPEGGSIRDLLEPFDAQSIQAQRLMRPAMLSARVGPGLREVDALKDNANE